MADYRLRPARRGDAADLAILDNIAGHGISHWFWQGAVNMGKASDAYEWGRARLADENALFGWTNTVVAERDGEILGAANGYVMPPADAEDEKSNPLQFVPVFELFAEAAGDWVVDSLAVYSHARGQGVGAALLDDCFLRASKSRADAISLVAEDSNQSALALYRSRGLKERARRDFISFGSKSDTKHWLLLTTPLG